MCQLAPRRDSAIAAQPNHGYHRSAARSFDSASLCIAGAPSARQDRDRAGRGPQAGTRCVAATPRASAARLAPQACGRRRRGGLARCMRESRPRTRGSGCAPLCVGPYRHGRDRLEVGTPPTRWRGCRAARCASTPTISWRSSGTGSSSPTESGNVRSPTHGSPCTGAGRVGDGRGDDERPARRDGAGRSRSPRRPTRLPWSSPRGRRSSRRPARPARRATMTMPCGP